MASSRMRTPLGGAVVLITGAASGIGKEMAEGAAHRGAKHVIVWDIDEEGGEIAASEIRSFGADAHVLSRGPHGSRRRRRCR